MILVNTTFCVDSAIAQDFINFIADRYIPLSSASGLYAPLLTEMRCPPETDTPVPPRTFALQMRAPSQKTLDEFRQSVLPGIYRRIGAKWGMGVAMFESTLDVIHDFPQNDTRRD